MKGMNTELSAFLEEKNFLPVGEQNPKIKQIKGILSNSKPNPQKLFVAEGIWILKMCEKFAAPSNRWCSAPRISAPRRPPNS